MTNRDTLSKLGACREALDWSEGYKTKQAAWDACERGDWLLWYCGQMSGPPDSPSRRKLVLVAAECAALALPLVSDDETYAICEATIQTCYAYAYGEASLEDVRAAYAAAAAAANAYAAAAAAAAANAYAASYAASYAAADAASAAAYAANANAYARSETLAKCADIVRAYYPTPPTKE